MLPSGVWDPKLSIQLGIVCYGFIIADSASFIISGYTDTTCLLTQVSLILSTLFLPFSYNVYIYKLQ